MDGDDASDRQRGGGPSVAAVDGQEWAAIVVLKLWLQLSLSCPVYMLSRGSKHNMAPPPPEHCQIVTPETALRRW